MEVQNAASDFRAKQRWNLGGFLLLLSLLALGSYLTARVSSPVHFFHLVTGNWILSHIALPSEDLWTLIGKGRTWVADSWLFDLLIASIETHFGWRGVGVAALVATGSFVVATGFLLAREARNPVVGFLITTLVACGVLEQEELSPRLFGFTLLALACWFATSALSTPKRVIGLFLCSALVANLHPTFFLFPFFIASLSRERAKRKFALCGISLLGGFFTPSFGGQLYQWILMLNAEFQLAVRFQDTAATVYLFSFSFLILVWILFVLLLPREKNVFLPALAILSGLLSVFGLAERSLVAYALFAAGILLASVLRYWFEEERRHTPELVLAIKKLVAGISRIPLAGGIWLMFCIVVVNCLTQLRYPVVDAFLPRRAIDAFIERQLPVPLLHEAVVGPYLEYRFQAGGVDSGLRAMIDHRLPLFSLPFAVSERAMKNLQPGWDELLKNYQPNSILVRKSTPLYEVFSRSKDWKIQYDDTDVNEADEGTPGEDIETARPTRQKQSFGWVIFSRVSVHDSGTLR